MSETEKILNELRAVRAEVAQLASDNSLSRVTYFENLSPLAVVGTDYVAYRFGCSIDAVKRGSYNTKLIPKLPDRKELKYIKREVDNVWMNLNKTVSEKAARLRAKK